SLIASTTYTPGGSPCGWTLDGSLPLVLAAFFGLGLLLSLTPCVYPMVPILAGILARGGAASRSAALPTSLSYVLAMAAAYALLGLAAAWSGQNLQAALQTPVATGAAAILFAALALSMLGAFDLQVPQALAQRLSGASSGLGGRVLGPAALGFVSALIVGPCATPPLAAALLYVTQTGDVARGSAALFALGLGMGAPLLAVGAFGARILPKSGPWMVRVKQLFGVAFLAIAISMAARALPAQAAMLLWGAALITIGVFAGAWDRLGPHSPPLSRVFKAAGLVVSVWGASLIVGAAAGGDDPRRPLAALAAASPAADQPSEVRNVVSTPAEYDRVLQMARDAGRPAVVTFTADWCPTCKANDRALDRDPEIRALLAHFAAVTVDVTSMSPDVRALMSRENVVGPPTLLVRDRQGSERLSARLVGSIDVDVLGEELKRALH
ncbi:protein-disulfide reductase DsbD family protein, partial [Hansschlegelia beijingensis]